MMMMPDVMLKNDSAYDTESGVRTSFGEALSGVNN